MQRPPSSPQHAKPRQSSYKGKDLKASDQKRRGSTAIVTCSSYLQLRRPRSGVVICINWKHFARVKGIRPGDEVVLVGEFVGGEESYSGAIHSGASKKGQIVWQRYLGSSAVKL
ncbi:hypothetical protein PTKIN_Ptkin10aG0139500 [Pterospermum kingtungense]